MFKKIGLYGLAFGSISGAFLFIHLQNYSAQISGFQQVSFMLIQSILIPFTCIYLLVKTLRKEILAKGNDFKPGSAVFIGLFASIVLALTVTLIYTLIAQQFPGIIENAALTDMAKIEANAAKYEEVYKKTAAELKQLARERYDIGNQLRDNMFQFTSMGLVVSGILALLFLRKDKKQSE